MRQVVEARLLDVDLPAEPQSASRARRAVRESLQGIAVDRDAIGVVVSEAVTNAVLHAYRHRDRPGDLHVAVRLHDEDVEVTVTDGGVGLQPRADSPGIGLGMPLIAGLADHVVIADRDPGVRVTARFALMGAAGPHGRPGARTVGAAPHGARPACSPS